MAFLRHAGLNGLNPMFHHKDVGQVLLGLHSKMQIALFAGARSICTMQVKQNTCRSTSLLNFERHGRK